MRRFLVVFMLLYSFPAVLSAVTIDWATVDDAGNAPHTSGYGAVDYDFRISKFEITQLQYTEFLNAVAADDPNALYSTNILSPSVASGIFREGTPGNYSYANLIGTENRPFGFANFYRAVRFANWLHNGQPTGSQGPETTEDGAYTITPDGIADNSIQRNDDARVFLPTYDEWLKAGYYSGSDETGYWQYPYQSNDETIGEPPPGGTNSANTWLAGLRVPIDVGSYPLSVGPYGTHDQGGNVWEWSETKLRDTGFLHRGKHGGSWLSPVGLDIDETTGQSIIDTGNGQTGIRLASVVPEPSSGCFVLAFFFAGCLAWRDESWLARNVR